jgi:cold shock CspA family protein
MKGQIVRLVTDKGFGFIRGTDGVEYFFHRTAVKNGEFEALRQGDDVEIDDCDDGPKGPRTDRVFIE